MTEGGHCGLRRCGGNKISDEYKITGNDGEAGQVVNGTCKMVCKMPMVISAKYRRPRQELDRVQRSCYPLSCPASGCEHGPSALTLAGDAAGMTTIGGWAAAWTI